MLFLELLRAFSHNCFVVIEQVLRISRNICFMQGALIVFKVSRAFRFILLYYDHVYPFFHHLLLYYLLEFVFVLRYKPYKTSIIPVMLKIDSISFKKITESIVPSTGTASCIVPVIVAVSSCNIIKYK